MYFGFLVICLAALNCFVYSSTEAKEPEHLSNKITSFTVDLTKIFHQASNGEGNVLFSPLNIYTALSILQFASSGKTRDEVSDFLGFPKDDKRLLQVHTNIAEVLRSIQYQGNWTYTFVNIANGLFVQNNYAIKPSFINESSSYYDNKVENVDFEKNAKEATDIINKWVSDKTKGEISQLFSEPLRSDTIILLASALYFNGKWAEPFSPYRTKVEKFNNGKENVEVQMMNNDDFVPYSNNPSLKVESLTLYYAGGNFSMTIILPYENQTLMDFIHNLKSEDLESILNSSQATYVDYKLPRIKFSWSQSLNEPLSTLGLRGVFSEADLSNMLSGGVRISEMRHAAQIELDESGTKASAITTIQVVPMSGQVFIGKPILFIANRPFLLLLRHEPTKNILFAATIHKP